MKLSTIAISALVAVSIHATAQTTTQKPKPVKQAAKTNKPAKPKKDTLKTTKDSVKRVNKDPDHYYCPPCGMG